jgi:hypothetical protein
VFLVCFGKQLPVIKHVTEDDIFLKASWELDQLKEDLSLDYWYMVACNPDLITTIFSLILVCGRKFCILGEADMLNLIRNPNPD